jgi:hypothetical protein
MAQSDDTDATPLRQLGGQLGQTGLQARHAGRHLAQSLVRRALRLAGALQGAAGEAREPLDVVLLDAAPHVVLRAVQLRLVRLGEVHCVRVYE